VFCCCCCCYCRDAALSWYLKFWEQEDGKGVWDNFDWDSNSWGAAVLLNRCENMPKHACDPDQQGWLQ
jgi:hypothetical protein